MIRACDQMATIGWLSKNSLDRHRPAFLAAEISLFFIGTLFWIDATQNAVGFADQIFGKFAYSLPAKMWAGIMMYASFLLILGLKRPVKNWLVVAGASFHCIHFVLLSYSAVFTGGAFVIGLFCSVFFLPLHIWILFEALGRAK